MENLNQVDSSLFETGTHCDPDAECPFISEELAERPEDCSKLEAIPIDEIEVLPHRRDLKEETVETLVTSISQIGLRMPISIHRDEERGRYVLVAGRHRLEAARRLGWKTINALLAEGTPEERRMWEIAENLHRAELTVLERDEQIAEWVRLVEKISSANKLAQLAPVSKGGRGKESGIRAAARTAPSTARLSASVPPLVKTTSAG